MQHAVQAATFYFTVSSTGMMCIDQCIMQLDQHTTLRQHGLLEALQSSLHNTNLHLPFAIERVADRSLLLPPIVLAHVWPEYLQMFPSGHPPITQVCDRAQQVGQLCHRQAQLSRVMAIFSA